MRQVASYLPRYGARDCAQGLPPVPGTFGHGSESAQYVTLYILALRLLSTRREYRHISATLMIRLMVRAEDVHCNASEMARNVRGVTRGSNVLTVLSLSIQKLNDRM